MKNATRHGCADVDGGRERVKRSNNAMPIEWMTTHKASSRKDATSPGRMASGGAGEEVVHRVGHAGVAVDPAGSPVDALPPQLVADGRAGFHDLQADAVGREFGVQRAE